MFGKTFCALQGIPDHRTKFKQNKKWPRGKFSSDCSNWKWNDPQVKKKIQKSRLFEKPLRTLDISLENKNTFKKKI